MRDLDGKVAVVTGAASGIGLALAARFAREGMKVVLADIEEPALAAAVQELRQQEHDVIGVRTDVASADSVEELARRTLAAYGKVHLVCDNAGVINAATPLWEATEKDWRWMLGVNVWGVIHGLRTFLPFMLAQDEDGYMVNTASIAGLGMGSSIYSVTKHAVLAITEALYMQLKARDAKVGVSVMCPVFVNTRIVEAERNRPVELWNEGAASEASGWDALAERLRNGISPQEMAEIALQGIREERFYIIPDDYAEEGFRTWADNLINRRNPVSRPRF